MIVEAQKVDKYPLCVDCATKERNVSKIKHRNRKRRRSQSLTKSVVWIAGDVWDLGVDVLLDMFHERLGPGIKTFFPVSNGAVNRHDTTRHPIANIQLFKTIVNSTYNHGSEWKTSY